MKTIKRSIIYLYIVAGCSLLWNCNEPHSKASVVTHISNTPLNISLPEYTVTTCLNDIVVSAIMAKKTKLKHHQYFLSLISDDRYKIITIHPGLIKKNETSGYDGIINFYGKFIWCEGIKADSLFVRTNRSIDVSNMNFISDSVKVFPAYEEPSISKIIKACKGLPILLEVYYEL